MAANEAIRKLLKAKESAEVDDQSGDVVFAMFLEPHSQDPSSGPPNMLDKLISYVVNNLQPSPVMVHVELVVPPSPGSGAPVNFATYYGDRSDWRTDRKENAAYYMSTTAGKWRAVPVFGKHAARLVRATCDKSLKVKYSLFRYVTAAWGIRKMAAAVPDGPQQPAHCATLTARMLRRGILNSLEHPSAYYGPASLYIELRDRLHKMQIVPDTTELGQVSLQVDRLLKHRDEDVRFMTDDEFSSAIRALTLRASAAAASGDAAMQVMTQKQLATGLFRWSILRR
jgi:hypothetical protein